VTDDADADAATAAIARTTMNADATRGSFLLLRCTSVTLPGHANI
jgi:hypothetical protein